MVDEMHRAWGLNLKLYREKEHLSQRAFAEKIGVRPSTVCRWEAGMVPGDQMKVTLAAFFHVDVRVLFPLVGY